MTPFLFVLSAKIPISPQRRKHREHQLHTTKQTNYCMFSIYQCPVHLQLLDLQI